MGGLLKRPLSPSDLLDPLSATKRARANLSFQPTADALQSAGSALLAPETCVADSLVDNRTLQPCSGRLNTPTPSSVPAPAIGPFADAAGSSLERSRVMLEFSTHEAAREVSQKMRDSTQTSVTYKRVFDNYARFMEVSEFEKHQLDPAYQCIPAEPITAANVAAFLKHESSREKVRGSSLLCPKNP